MKIDKALVKEDLNFLEHPTWVINEKSGKRDYVIKKDKGTYSIKSSEELPNRFDRIVLYYLLHRVFVADVLRRELKLTRYELTKNIFFSTKSIGKTHYDRVAVALAKWAGITISFEGVFFEGDNHTYRIFHIIDDVILDEKSKELLIRFNKQYIQQLQETKFYKLIDFHEYKKLTKPISARLYEILVKNFKDRNIWFIGIFNLAEKLTLQRSYSSQIFIALKPAIEEINKKTELKIDLDYDKGKQLCTFKRLAKKSAAQDSASSVLGDQITQDPTITLLVNYGIAQEKAEAIFTKYSADKIKHKIELLKQNKQAIKNVAAWLIKALDQDWDVQTYNQELKEQKLKAERARQQKEKEAQDKKLQLLKKEHEQFVAAKIDQTYKALPAKLAKLYDTQFDIWADEQKAKTSGFAMPDEIYRIKFFQDLFLEEDEQDFDKWLSKRL